MGNKVETVLLTLEKSEWREEQSGYVVTRKWGRRSFLEWKKLVQVVGLRRKSQESKSL